jgi:hypothetical protein
MRGAPHNGFALLILPISPRVSRAALGLLSRRQDFQRQQRESLVAASAVRSRFDDDNGEGEQIVQPDPNQSIDAPHANRLSRLAAQHQQLLTQDEALCLVAQREIQTQNTARASSDLPTRTSHVAVTHLPHVLTWSNFD